MRRLLGLNFSFYFSSLSATDSNQVSRFIKSICPGGDMEVCIKEAGLQGVALGIIENGELTWSKEFGYREIGTQFKVDMDTVFLVGSVSKVINAAIVLRLVAEGRLDLDKRVLLII